MTHYYKLPEDIYCWGQNRGGTIIPLISQLFYKSFGFSAINAVSVSDYILLIIGFLGFSSLFKNDFTKIIFALFWFFPPLWFIDGLRFPYGIEYCFIGAAIFIINKLTITVGQKITGRQHLMLFSLIIICTSAVWVSDLAAVTILVLFSTLSFFYLFKNKTFFPHKGVLLYFISGCVFCAGFILYAKDTAGFKNPDYIKINSFAEALNGLKVTGDTLFQFISFKTNNLFMSIYAYLLLLLLVVVLISFRKTRVKFSFKTKQWFCFFLLDGLIVFGIILFSHWAFIDGYGRRFYICCYISFGLAMLILTDHLISVDEGKNVLKIILATCVIIGSVSTVYDLEFVNPKSLKPTYENMREFETLGNCDLIGDYWNSYIVSISDPGLIKAISYEGQENRNDDIVKEVFKGSQIYIIKDDWLKTYPDTLVQYWHLLLKDGKEFTMGGKSVCRYKKIN
jgi:hypothetical protein